MATHSSILAWEIPWIEEAGELQSTQSQRAGRGWATNTLTWTLYRWHHWTECPPWGSDASLMRFMLKQQQCFENCSGHCCIPWFDLQFWLHLSWEMITFGWRQIELYLMLIKGYSSTMNALNTKMYHPSERCLIWADSQNDLVSSVMSPFSVCASPALLWCPWRELCPWLSEFTFVVCGLFVDNIVRKIGHGAGLQIYGWVNQVLG